MVLIVSSNRDQTTLKVVEYFRQWNTKYIFIHEENKITNITIDFPSISLVLENNLKIDLNKVRSFWYRRADFFFDKQQIKQSIPHPTITKYLENEWLIVKNYLYKVLAGKKSLGDFFLAQQPNKLNNLLIAQKHEIKIPKTIITASKKALLDFWNQHKFTEIITKNIGENFGTRIVDKIIYQLGTTKVKKNQIDSLSDTFYPILVQECLQKEYEVRVFFIKDQFYAMAIFSQGNTKTEVDFRHYDQKRPNRKVPYKLPAEIEEKLSKSMMEIGLDTGSIDLVVTKEKEYYFLEVNPIGQFSWLSSTCNYYFQKGTKFCS